MKRARKAVKTMGKLQKQENLGGGDFFGEIFGGSGIGDDFGDFFGYFYQKVGENLVKLSGHTGPACSRGACKSSVCNCYSCYSDLLTIFFLTRDFWITFGYPGLS